LFVVGFQSNCNENTAANSTAKVKVTPVDPTTTNRLAAVFDRVERNGRSKTRL
jgi:hypothetical protein